MTKTSVWTLYRVLRLPASIRIEVYRVQRLIGSIKLLE